MRQWILAGVLVVAACSSAQELATTTSTAPSIPVTTSSSPTTTPLPTTSATSSQPLESLAYEHIADLDFPVHVVARPGDDISYVVSKSGLVWGMVDGQILPDPVLDISARVGGGSEQGLLSIALHPTERPFFYAHYSDRTGDTVVSEFKFRTPTEADPNTERVLLTVDQPAANHNGGMVLFHPDGRLLVGLGDGGGSGDQFGNGQNTETLLGGLVALNVAGSPDPTLFSYGLRNPWRFWIHDDSLLYIADVGQSAFEEVSVAPLAPNQNFGWPITEGLHCFRPSSDCNTSGMVLPVLEVAHEDDGTCSISGGVVYTGSAIPELNSHYLYSDFCGGYLRSFRFNGMGQPLTEEDWTDQVGNAGRVTGFGVDGHREVYVTTTTSLLKLIAIR